MKMSMKLDHDTMVQAVTEFLRRKFPNVQVDKVEYLTEDQVWGVSVQILEAATLPTGSRPDPDPSEPMGQVQTSDPDDDEEFGGGEDLPPLDEADLASMGLDLSTPEGKAAGRKARRGMAENRGRRARNLQIT